MVLTAHSAPPNAIPPSYRRENSLPMLPCNGFKKKSTPYFSPPSTRIIKTSPIKKKNTYDLSRISCNQKPEKIEPYRTIPNEIQKTYFFKILREEYGLPALQKIKDFEFFLKTQSQDSEHPNKALTTAHKYNLSNEEVFSLFLYTTTDFNRGINTSLRKGETYSKSCILAIKNICTAMEKLPPYGAEKKDENSKGVVIFRVVHLPKDVSQSYKTNNCIRDKGFLSMTASYGIMNKLNKTYKNIGSHRMTIALKENTKVKDISMFSQFAEEEELLAPPGTAFAVRHMQEETPPTPSSSPLFSRKNKKKPRNWRLILEET